MPGPETTLPPGHPDQTESETAQLAAGFKEYEDGKHRRYELLFKVNGAAFAIAALAFKPESKDFIQSVVGLPTLGVGMMLLTLLLGADIFAFGWDMKQMETRFGKETLSAAPWLGKVTPLGKGLFRPVGMGVLAAIVALIALGWLCVVINGHPR